MEKITDADIFEVTNKTKLDRSQLRRLFKTGLGLEHHDIEAAELSANDRDYRLQAENVLRVWRQRNGNSATRWKILDGMKRCEFEEALGILQEKWNLSHYVNSETTRRKDVTNEQNLPKNETILEHPRGVKAIPAFMPYNVLIQRIIERIDEDCLLLERLKIYCRSFDEYTYGIPSYMLENVKGGKDFIEALEKCCLLSPGNLIYLQHLLMTAAKEGRSQCYDLVYDIEEYGQKYPEQKILHFQRLHKVVDSKASGKFVTRIKIHVTQSFFVKGRTRNFANLNIPELLDVLHDQLGIPRYLINVIGLTEGSIMLFIQLPRFWNNCDIRDKWIQITTSPDIPEWIQHFSIIVVHVSNDLDLHVTFNKILPVHEFRVKMILLGSSGTGKSSLLYRFLKNDFDEYQYTTIGLDVSTKKIKADDKLLHLTVADTAGQERFLSLTQNYYRGTHSAMLVYDVTCRESFDKIQFWLTAIRREIPENIAILLCGNKKDFEKRREVSYEKGSGNKKHLEKRREVSYEDGSGYKKGLEKRREFSKEEAIGNKKDLEKRREVSYEEASKFAQANGLLFVETSAKTGENVNAAFLELATAIGKKIDRCDLNIASIEEEEERNMAEQRRRVARITQFAIDTTEDALHLCTWC